METITLVATHSNRKKSPELGKEFDTLIESNFNEIKFANTEAALIWIVRGR